MPEAAAVAETPAAEQVTVTPTQETPTVPQGARSHYESRREQLVAEADKDSLSADQFDALIGKADQAAKESLVRVGVQKADDAKPAPVADPAKPPAPSEVETL